jgi:hypothetical protein
VRDAAGRRVGTVLRLEGAQPVVALEKEDELAVVQVVREGFRRGSTSVVFQSPDCTGPPFLRDELASIPGNAVQPILRPTGLVPGPALVIASGAPSAPTLLGSALDHEGLNCQPVAVTLPALPATEFLDLGAFTPPFTLR